MAERRPVITLMTDFGEADYYVPAMKGAILTVNPQAEIIDLTHQIPPHDLYAAAFMLLCCYTDFPKMTLHVVVVDPGVGTDRRPLLLMTDNYNFIGPDNGVFSYIYQREHVYRIVHLNETHYFRQPVSNTFHGRDVFGPCAGYVSKLVDWSKMGVEVSDPVRFNTPTAVVVSDKQVRGHGLHVDRFGNLITNITAAELPLERARAGARIRVRKHEATRVLNTYGEANQGELFAYFGSAGFLELAVPRQHAGRTIEARPRPASEATLP